MPKCTGCDQDKDPSEFHVNRARPSGHEEKCKECKGKATADSRARSRLTPADYQGMDPWATDYERLVVAAFIETGSLEAAAARLDSTPHHVRANLRELHRRAATKGWSPGHDMDKTVPDGYHVKGVSTYYGKDGERKGQWVKSTKDKEHQLEQLFDAFSAISEPMRGKSVPLERDDVFPDDDLLCIYPMGDPHIGMFAWARETGTDFDLKIAESNLVSAVDRLVSIAPPAKTALIMNLGDFYHADNPKNETPHSGNKLDVDSRWPKVLKVGIRIMRRLIDRALTRHETVHVINEIGNHDDCSSIFLAVALGAYYENNPRVVIDDSEAKCHWFRFGSSFFGVTHGNGIKKEQLPGVMACDRPRDWGECDYRYWYTGHIHHDSVREYPGCIVESFRTLAPSDKWHRDSGYRSGQDMKCDIVHKRYGRIARNIIGIQQIQDRVTVVPR